MTFLTSLLPGVREVRAPLIAGYLWMAFIWLVANPATPDSNGSGLYNRLDELTQAVSPVGLAIAASVAAYLIGSLLTTSIIWTVRKVNARWSIDVHWPKGLAFNEKQESSPEPAIEERDGKVPVEALKEITGIGRERTSMGRFDSSLLRSIGEMTDRELGEAQRELNAAIDRAGQHSDQVAYLRILQRGNTPIAQFKIKGKNEDPTEPSSITKEFAIPRFSPSRDLFREFPILRSRLVEYAETTGTKIERISSEAELRFAVAAPLFALIGLFAKTNPAWALVFILPTALVLQGVSLERQGNRELVDALRARSDIGDLGKITPLFDRYRKEAGKLRDALDEGVWERRPQKDSVHA